MPTARGRGRRLTVLTGLVLTLVFAAVWLGYRQFVPAGHQKVSPLAPVIAQIQRVVTKVPPDPIVVGAGPRRPERAADMFASGLPRLYAFLAPDPGVIPASLKVVVRRLTPPAGDLPPPRIAVDPADPRGAIATLSAPSGGFSPGLYEISCTAGAAHQSATFLVVQGAEAIIGQTAPAEAEAVLTKGCLALAVKPDGSPERPVRQIAQPAARIYLVFYYARAEPGTALTVRWSLNGQALPQASREVTLRGAEGWAHAWIQASAGLPAGHLRASVRLTGDEEELLKCEAPVVALRQ